MLFLSASAGNGLHMTAKGEARLLARGTANAELENQLRAYDERRAAYVAGYPMRAQPTPWAALQSNKGAAAPAEVDPFTIDRFKSIESFPSL